MFVVRGVLLCVVYLRGCCSLLPVACCLVLIIYCVLCAGCAVECYLFGGVVGVVRVAVVVCWLLDVCC